MNPVTLAAARAAKAKLAPQLEALPELRGLGIAMHDGGFALKVNLASATCFPIPKEVDGVPVIVAIVGPIRPL